MCRTLLVSLVAVSASLGCSAAGKPASGGGTGGEPEEETGGTTGTGGKTSTGGKGGAGTGGSTGGSGGTAVKPDAGVDATVVPDSAPDVAAELPRFSFFVTSIRAMKRLSKNELGFGGNLRYGMPTGLEGADKICTEVAESVMPGSGAKVWRAFLSTVAGGPDGGPVHAITRIGEGPWYDKMGRLVAMNRTNILKTRPEGADPAIINDLPNEDGIPNHTDGAPGCTGNNCPDNHDTLTGTGPNGMLYRMDRTYTCNDWTNSERTGRPWCGHSWPRQGSGVNWMSALPEGGCAPGVNLREQGGPNAPTVGSGGGYGGIYCFALKP